MNTFDLTIKHNLHVGMQNAINQIAHLENLIGIADGKAGFSDTSRYVIKELERLQESLSLIEPEGGQTEWVSVDERLPEINSEYIVYSEDYNRVDVLYFNTGNFCEYGPDMNFTDSEFGDSITHWRPLPSPPVTLSEASNHSFQQGVEIQDK